MTFRWKAGLLGVAAALLLFGGATTAQPRYDRNCSARIEREIRKLDRDIRRHGFFSRQAQHRREIIRRLRAECSYPGWRNRRWFRSYDPWDGRRWVLRRR
jgi:hypothetical protein